MLLNDLYTITDFTHEEGAVEANLVIDVGHRIFEGHFPGQPVTPGVCMMQMIKEIAEKAIDKKLQLKKADDMKFLAIIDPQKNNIVKASLKYTIAVNTMSVSATITKEELTHFKFKGSFVFQEPT